MRLTFRSDPSFRLVPLAGATVPAWLGVAEWALSGPQGRLIGALHDGSLSGVGAGP